MFRKLFLVITLSILSLVAKPVDVLDKMDFNKLKEYGASCVKKNRKNEALGGRRDGREAAALR